MSLVSTASLWTNDNIQNQTKKRQPSMRRNTVKLRPYNDSTMSDTEEYVSQTENYQNLQKNAPSTIEETQEAQSVKSDKINEILNKITTMDAENSGNKLANFVPLEKPSFTTDKKSSSVDKNEYHYKSTLTPDELLPQTLHNSMVKPFGTNDSDMSNYQHTYESAPIFQGSENYKHKPYYASMGVSQNADNKLLEKVNYMIHLLEEQQNEKTAYITEEFILYVFLGVFVIFTIDSFTRIGKYVR